MSRYQPPKMSRSRTNYFKHKRRRRHVVIVLCSIAIIAVAVAGTRSLLRSFPSNEKTLSAPSSSVVNKKAVTPQKATTIDKSSWQLRLVNNTHPLPENFTVQTSIVAGHRFDSRAAPFLQKLISDCNAQGHHLLICSAYRSISYQTSLFKTEIQKAEQNGASDAVQTAATVVAKPGTSEHNLGLAVDFGSTGNQLCDESFGNTPEGQWLMQNAYKYGFILRYPKGKEDITKIIYEPWHYRYIGTAAAKEMQGKNICLEEYVGQA